jgi:hypothetical protein
LNLSNSVELNPHKVVAAREGPLSEDDVETYENETLSLSKIEYSHGGTQFSSAKKENVGEFNVI